MLASLVQPWVTSTRQRGFQYLMYYLFGIRYSKLWVELSAWENYSCITASYAGGFSIGLSI
jgi:hypothetical protein